jgi:hypothetical protein
MAAAAEVAVVEGFTASRERFTTVLGFLDGAEAAAASHAQLEERLQVESRELFCQLLQDHLDLRAQREVQVAVLGADGTARSRVETGHTRALRTVFGKVDLARIAYRAPARPNLHPADAVLNLPGERHSHGLRRLAAVEATRGSYHDAVAGIIAATGQRLGKRQVEALAARAAVDIGAFYTLRKPSPAPGDDVLVLSCDGKGIVMRAEALRPATAKAAATATSKLATRLSKGEKRNRKRMAEVGTVYDAVPAVRTPADILPAADALEPAPGPRTTNKWLVASVIDNAADVVAQIFAEAARRDPTHARTWIALSTATTTKSTGSPPRPEPTTYRSPSSSTSSTCSNTCGRPPGPSTPKATPTPRHGFAATPRRSSQATQPEWPGRSDAKQPQPG